MLIVCGSERWTSCPINHEKANWMVLPGMESVHSERGRLAVECPPVCGVVSGQRKPWQRGYGAAQARHSLPELTGSPGRWPASKTAPISIWSGLNQMPAASGMTPEWMMVGAERSEPVLRVGVGTRRESFGSGLEVVHSLDGQRFLARVPIASAGSLWGN